jgi:molybdopterin synthase sulfur carrier subunit
MAMNRLNLMYFAILREESGAAREMVNSSAGSFRDLYEELSDLHGGFSLPPELVSVAVNGAFRNMGDVPKDGDEVVFIPPVAGG